MKRSAVHFFAACFVLAGCATTPSFPEPDKSWQTFNGQLQYITTGSRVIGEFEASSRDGDFRLQFTKGGAVPLIRVSRHQEYAHAEGALARGHWQGSADKAPAPLRGWVNEVPRALMAATRNAAQPPRRMEINGAQPGERFVFVFDR